MYKMLDNSTRARRAILSLVVFILYGSTMLVTDYMELDLLTMIHEGIVIPITNIETASTSKFILGVLYLAILFSTFITFLSWFYRAYKNLHNAGMQGLKHSPLWSIAGFMVPVINLVRPYAIMKEIWNRNVELTRDHAPHLGGSAPPVGVWWILCLMTFLSETLLFIASIRGASIEQVINANFLSIIANLLIILSAVTAIIVIRKVSLLESEAYKSQG